MTKHTLEQINQMSVLELVRSYGQLSAQRRTLEDVDPDHVLPEYKTICALMEAIENQAANLDCELACAKSMRRAYWVK